METENEESDSVHNDVHVRKIKSTHFIIVLLFYLTELHAHSAGKFLLSVRE